MTRAVEDVEGLIGFGFGGNAPRTGHGFQNGHDLKIPQMPGIPDPHRRNDKTPAPKIMPTEAIRSDVSLKNTMPQMTANPT